MKSMRVRLLLALLVGAVVQDVGLSVSLQGVDLAEHRASPDQVVSGSALPFGEELGPDDLATWYELEEMVAGHNQIVLPDCPLSGLRDDLARWIPVEGLDVVLRPPALRRAFLYIDFVGFFAREHEAAARELACLPGRRESHFASGKGGPYGYVEVFVNERRKGIFYRGADAGFTGPLVVDISRDEFVDGKVRVRLRPSNRSFAVWDLFLSNVPPEE